MFKVEPTYDDYTPVRLTLLDPPRSIDLTQCQVEHLRAELLRQMEQRFVRTPSGHRCTSRYRRTEPTK